MQWRNTSSRYGVFSLFLHWGSALVVFGLFGLGLWMRELSYYDPWYHPAPALHKSIGILLAIALLVRIVWRFVSPPPPAPANHGPLTRVASKLGHLALYGLLLAVIVAGYLISTADGEPISVFGWFSVPATLSGLPDQADVAGEIHLPGLGAGGLRRPPCPGRPQASLRRPRPDPKAHARSLVE